MIILRLFAIFFKIGLFTFGGGYAMIPLIQAEISRYGWLTASEFADILAIAEMTPGPIAVNAATFVGYRVAGFFGGLLATLGVILPSLILGIIVAKFFFKFSEHPFVKGIFYGIRPVIVALIIAAIVFVAQTSIFKAPFTLDSLVGIFKTPSTYIDIPSVVITLASLFVMTKHKLHPILALLGSAIIGIVMFHVVGI